MDRLIVFCTKVRSSVLGAGPCALPKLPANSWRVCFLVSQTESWPSAQPMLPRLDDRRSSTTFPGRGLDIGAAAGAERGWVGESSVRPDNPDSSRINKINVVIMILISNLIIVIVTVAAKTNAAIHKWMARQETEPR